MESRAVCTENLDPLEDRTCTVTAAAPPTVSEPLARPESPSVPIALGQGRSGPDPKKGGSRKGREPGLSLACKGGKGAIGSFRKRYSRNQKGGRRRNKREKVNSFLFFIFTSRGRWGFSRDVDVYRDASRPSHVTKEWGCPAV